MQFLGFTLPTDFSDASAEQMLAWGCQHWQVSQLPEAIEITPRFSNGPA
ncbi:glutamyl-Q tRNA(Asp) synthetase [Vibrio cholerae]|nr:glutamyl-Q tRNA(Asp) synthetase [Vibrio cholerae]